MTRVQPAARRRITYSCAGLLLLLLLQLGAHQPAHGLVEALHLGVAGVFGKRLWVARNLGHCGHDLWVIKAWEII